MKMRPQDRPTPPPSRPAPRPKECVSPEEWRAFMAKLRASLNTIPDEGGPRGEVSPRPRSGKCGDCHWHGMGACLARPFTDEMVAGREQFYAHHSDPKKQLWYPLVDAEQVRTCWMPRWPAAEHSEVSAKERE